MNVFVFFTLVLLLLIILLFNLIFITRIISDLISHWHGAPFVPIPLNVAQRALQLAELDSNDILYDLGSGDGRVLCLAVKEFGVQKAVGCEVGWWPYLSSKFKVQSSKLGNKIKIYRKDMFTNTLSGASVVFLYLMPQLLKRLEPKLIRELSPETHIICCRYPLMNKGFKILKNTVVEGISVWVYEIRGDYIN